jgi:ubiquinone biosynthesis protein
MVSIRKIGVLSRNYRHLSRYRHIVSVLLNYGFDELIEALKIERYFEIGLQLIAKQGKKKLTKFNRSERLRMALEELGPAFVKLGQIASTRPDLLPSDITSELSKLQDDVKPFDFDVVEKTVEDELNRSLKDVFEWFDPNPIASASIGQVHRARLKNGEDVAVKVQRPDAQDMIEVDLEIILHLASLIENHLEEAKIQRPTRFVAEFARSIKKEIDYNIEASHIERFALQFQGDMEIYVPKVFHDASTSRVLTMEYIDGVKSSDLHRLEREGLDRKTVTARGTDLLLKQIFEHGFFHADPHPGNVFVLPNNVICYLDYGMMGRVDIRTRENFADLVYGLSKRDESKTVKGLLKLLEFDEEPDLRSLERDMGDFMERHLYKQLKDIKVGQLIQELTEFLSLHRLRIPQDLYLMVKSISTAEGLGLALDPNFQMLERATPFLFKAKSARFHPRRIADDIFETSIDFMRLMLEIPGEFRDILALIKRGKIKAELEPKGLDPIFEKQDQISNRIAFSIVIASLIIGSALVVHSKTPPFFFGIPLFGVVGFITAGLMGVWLLMAIIKRGRL